MKILFVVPSMASLGFIEQLLLKVKESGFEVHVAASGFEFHGQNKSVEGIEFHALDMPRGANPAAHFKAAIQLRKLVNSIKPNFIDVHFSAAMLTCAVAKSKNWPKMHATIQGLRFPMFAGVRGRVEKMVECWAASQMDETVVLTQDDYQALIAARVENARLQKAPGFGCDIAKFDANRLADTVDETLEQCPSIKADSICFIYVGRKVAFKGFDRVVKAFFSTYERNPKLRLIVCGNEDPMHATGLTDAELEKYTSHPGVVDIGWTNQVEKYLRISHVNVFPSKREGMPVNLMESLVMGVPVITYDVRGCKDIVNNNTTGIVLSDFTIDALASSMHQLSEDDQKRKSLTKEALRLRDYFDRKHFVNERVSSILGATH